MFGKMDIHKYNTVDLAYVNAVGSNVAFQHTHLRPSGGIHDA